MKSNGMIMKNKDDLKLALEQKKSEIYCEKCGWKNHMYAFEADRKLCKNCKTYIYKNKASKFKYKMKEVINKCKSSN